MPFPLQDSYGYPEYSYDKYGGRLREALDWLFLQPGRGLCFPTFSIANYIASWYAITFTITSLLSISRFHYVSILMTNTSWLKLQQLNLHSNMFRL